MSVFTLPVRLTFPVGSGGGTNTWHIRVSQPVDQDVKIKQAAGWIKDFYTQFAPRLCTGTKIDWDGSYRNADGTPTDGGQTDGAWHLDAGGGDGSGPAPAMVCVTWKSSVASRSGRGRTFVGPLAPNAFQGDGTLDAGLLAAVRQGADMLIASSKGNLDGTAVCVYSKLQNIARDVVGQNVNDKVAVLSSRRG